MYQHGQELYCFILRVVDLRRKVLSKLFLLLGYASGSAICFGSALIVVGLLYNEASLARSLVFLTYTLFATAAGLYLYFRMLKLLSSKRRVHSYPRVHHAKR